MDFKDIIEELRKLFPHGHSRFIDLTIAEMDLHSRKNHDYAHGGDPLGNFDRVATILSLYPDLDPSEPSTVAIIYLCKQFDAAMWQQSQKHSTVVEGNDERWGDISVYAKIIRLLKHKEKAQIDQKHRQTIRRSHHDTRP